MNRGVHPREPDVSTTVVASVSPEDLVSVDSITISTRPTSVPFRRLVYENIDSFILIEQNFII